MEGQYEARLRRRPQGGLEVELETLERIELSSEDLAKLHAVVMNACLDAFEDRSPPADLLIGVPLSDGREVTVAVVVLDDQ